MCGVRKTMKLTFIKYNSVPFHAIQETPTVLVCSHGGICCKNYVWFCESFHSLRPIRTMESYMSKAIHREMPNKTSISLWLNNYQASEAQIRLR